METPAKATRRRHSAAFKRKVLLLTNQPGASVAAIALEHGVNANLVFKWRRLQAVRPTSARSKRPAVLLPVMIDPMPPVSVASVVASGSGTTTQRTAAAGVIEIEFDGARVRLHGAVDEASVRCVLQTLRDTT